jgi:hypothetical protein
MRYVISPSASRLILLRPTLGDTLIEVARLIAAGSLEVYVTDTKDGRIYAADELLELVERQ